MTPLFSAWIASAVGAMLFFAAGFLLSRRHLAEAVAVDAVIPPRASPPEDDGADATAVDSLRTQINQLRTALRDARVNEQEYAGAQRELERTRGDREQLMQEARRDVVIELEAARRRVIELEQVQDENAALRQQASEAAALGQKLATMEAELRELRSHRPSTSPPPVPPVRVNRATMRTAGDERSKADQLSALLARLRVKNVRSIALADELGLPIVGHGEEVSSLSAFAGYVTDIGRKTRDFLPMGKIRRVTVEDENDGIVTACPMLGGEASITLITLTVGPGPSARQVSELLGSAASMLQ
jgi:hypothetical protein